jgi:hypothetical protein
MTNGKRPEASSESKSEPIFRVAAVVDEYTLVLNIGSAQGVTKQHSFLVYGIGPDVIDPETGENLGPLELVRGRGKVSHIQERMCTIASSTTTTIPGIKKIFKRDRPGALSYWMTGQSQFDEVEEAARTVIEPFDDPKVGDFARLL